MKKKKRLRRSLGLPFLNNNIGPNMRSLRAYHTVKQAEMAKILGISRQMLSHYENNKYPVPETVVETFILHFKIGFPELVTIKENLIAFLLLNLL